MFSVKLKGFDEAIAKLDELSRNADRMSGSHNVGLDKLLTDEFMKKNTSFDNASDFFDKGGFSFKNSEEFKAIDEKKFNKWVKVKTKFNSWDEMIKAAFVEYFKKGLGF